MITHEIPTEASFVKGAGYYRPMGRKIFAGIRNYLIYQRNRQIKYGISFEFILLYALYYSRLESNNRMYYAKGRKYDAEKTGWYKAPGDGSTGLGILCYLFHFSGSYYNFTFC